MNVEYINPFLMATPKVLKTMAFTDATAGKPFLKKEDLAGGDVSGIVGITGATEGSMSISFTESCICYIITNMFGEEVKGVNDEVKDAVGEIANMISGDARRVLSEKGIALSAAIPTVISGKNHTITHLSKGHAIAIPFSTPGGDFVVEICFNK